MAFYFFRVSYFITVLILLLNLSQIWPMALSSWFLFLWHTPIIYFEHFLNFWNNSMFQDHLVPTLSSPEIDHLSKFCVIRSFDFLLGALSVPPQLVQPCKDHGYIWGICMERCISGVQDNSWGVTGNKADYKVVQSVEFFVVSKWKSMKVSNQNSWLEIPVKRMGKEWALRLI